MNIEEQNLDNPQKPQLNIPDVSCCYICGAKEKRSGNSLHCWDIEYECGCRIWGGISDDGIYLDMACPNNSN